MCPHRKLLNKYEEIIINNNNNSVGCGGVRVCSVPCKRRVAGSNLRSDIGQVAHP